MTVAATDTATLSGIRLCDASWQHGCEVAIGPAGGRPTLVTPADVVRVHAAGCRDVLPLLDFWDDAARQWKRFELPATSEQDAANSTGRLDLSLEASDGHRHEVALTLVNDLFRLPDAPDVDDEDADSTDDRPAAEYRAMAIEELIDRHISLVAELQHDHVAHLTPGDWTWSGGVHRGTLWPLCTTLDRWQASADRSEPRMTLIVRLAEELPRRVADLCRRPRQVLARVREIVPAARVQQLDGGCLRWLARQPGRTVAEKAGGRQRLMGVARRESADTPENRVLRDFLVRGIRACGRYAREHRHARSHGRVIRVLRFRRLLRLALRDLALAGVRPLIGAARPNYVLQHDARYRPVWEAYVQLVRQEAEQDRVWRWRHRLWAEHCRLGLLCALRQRSTAGAALRSDALVYGEQDAGQFFAPQTGAAAWPLPAGDVVDVVHGTEVAEHPLVPAAVRAIAPDAVLLRRRGGKVVRVGLVFSRLTFDAHGATGLDTLAERLAGTPALRHCTAVLLTPTLQDRTSRTAGAARGIELPVPAQEGAAALGEAIDWLTAGRHDDGYDEGFDARRRFVGRLPGRAGGVSRVVWRRRG